MHPRETTAADPGSLRLARSFLALVLAVVGLMILGALVRAHGAGLACPDWPLCFGEFVPTMDVKVAFEYTHRVVAGGLGLVFLGLAWATWQQPAAFRRVRGLLALAAFLLWVQILLGALTVWQLLAIWTVTAHLVTANLFAVSLLLVALRLQRAAQGDPISGPVSAATRAWLPAAALLLGFQIVLGGLVSSSYAGLACPEWPACAGGAWFPAGDRNVTLHLLHRTNGYLVVLALAAAALASRGQRGVAGPATWALGLALLQVLAGVANVLYRLPVEITGLHSALAAALVLTLTAALARAFSGQHAAEGAAGSPVVGRAT